MSKSDQILAALKEGKHRLTLARKALVEILAGSESPLAATDLIEALKRKKQNADRSTVYRELTFLMEEGIIRELDFLDGKKRYEVTVGKAGHHHHLVCRKCDDVRCVELPNDVAEIERNISKKHGFLVEDHVLEFFGTCAECRAK